MFVTWAFQEGVFRHRVGELNLVWWVSEPHEPSIRARVTFSRLRLTVTNLHDLKGDLQPIDGEVNVRDRFPSATSLWSIVADYSRKYIINKFATFTASSEAVLMKIWAEYSTSRNFSQISANSTDNKRLPTFHSEFSNTTILSLKHRFPSDQRS